MIAPHTFRGACDASAALPAGPFWLAANDEDNVIRAYWRDRRHDRPVARFDLTPHLGADENPEADFEGVAELDGIAYWIGSHGRSRKARERPARRVLVATRFEASGEAPRVEAVGMPCRTLLEAIARVDHPAAQRIAAREDRAPEDGGINVEGLAAWRGGLLVGFRSPLYRGRAVLVRVANPAAATQGARIRIDAVQELDLGGRGVRSLETLPSGLLVLAGSAAGGREPALFHWCGRADAPAMPVLLPDLPDRFTPEGLVVTRDGGRATLHLFSDDGDAGEGMPCKERPPMGRRFRVLDVPVDL